MTGIVTSMHFFVWFSSFCSLSFFFMSKFFLLFDFLCNFLWPIIIVLEFSFPIESLKATLMLFFFWNPFISSLYKLFRLRDKSTSFYLYRNRGEFIFNFSGLMNFSRLPLTSFKRFEENLASCSNLSLSSGALEIICCLILDEDFLVYFFSLLVINYLWVFMATSREGLVLVMLSEVKWLLNYLDSSEFRSWFYLSVRHSPSVFLSLALDPFLRSILMGVGFKFLDYNFYFRLYICWSLSSMVRLSVWICAS